MDTKTSVFIIIQIVELVIFIVFLDRVKRDVLSKMKGNFEAILAFVGKDGFFDTLDKALVKAEKSLQTNDLKQEELATTIAEAQAELSSVRKARRSIVSTMLSIRQLQ
jgi:hypothetical protein